MWTGGVLGLLGSSREPGLGLWEIIGILVGGGSSPEAWAYFFPPKSPVFPLDFPPFPFPSQSPLASSLCPPTVFSCMCLPSPSKVHLDPPPLHPHVVRGKSGQHIQENSITDVYVWFELHSLYGNIFTR